VPYTRSDTDALQAGSLSDRTNHSISENSIREAKEKSEALLLNIMPRSVSGELKRRGFVEARNYSRCSVLYIHVKNSSRLQQVLSPFEFSQELNTLYRELDKITVSFGMEKIRCGPDYYLAVAGIPETVKIMPLPPWVPPVKSTSFCVRAQLCRKVGIYPAQKPGWPCIPAH
jgi:hypothetical protein